MPGRLAGMSSFQLRVIAICIAVNMLDGFDILAMAFTAPAIAKDWALDPKQLGVLFSVGPIGMILGSIVLGPLADRFGRRPLILACIALASLSMFAAAYCATISQLALARAITGFAIGGILPCINTMVAEYASPRGRSFSVALMQAGFSVGSSLGGFLAVWLLAQFGWNSVFLAGAILTGVLLPLAFAFMPESMAYLAAQPQRSNEAEAIRGRMGEMAALPEPSAEPHSLRNLLAGLGGYWTPLALVVLIFFCCTMGFYFINSWTPKMLVDSGMTEGQAVFGGALIPAGGLLAAIGLGLISLKRSITPVVALIALASALATAAFGQMVLNLVPTMLGVLVLGTLINAVQIGIYAIFPGLFPATIRAGATGLAIGLGRIGSVVSPWLAGVLLAGGWTRAGLFALMAIPYAIAAAAILRLRPLERH